MTTLLKVTNFLELTTCPAIFSCLDAGYLNSLASLSPSVHMLTCSGGVPDFLPSLLIEEKGTKDANVGGP